MGRRSVIVAGRIFPPAPDCRSGSWKDVRVIYLGEPGWWKANFHPYFATIL